MGVVNGFQKKAIRTNEFALRRSLKNAGSYFTRNRAEYLKSVLNHQNDTTVAIEKGVFRRLEKVLPSNQLVIAQARFKQLRRYLRAGVTLPHALQLIFLEHERQKLRPYKIPHNPRYRKKEVLQLELSTCEIEYMSLRLARRNAISHGYSELGEKIQKRIEYLVKSILEYRRILNTDRLQE